MRKLVTIPSQPQLSLMKPVKIKPMTTLGVLLILGMVFEITQWLLLTKCAESFRKASPQPHTELNKHKKNTCEESLEQLKVIDFENNISPIHSVLKTCTEAWKADLLTGQNVAKIHYSIRHLHYSYIKALLDYSLKKVCKDSRCRDLNFSLSAMGSSAAGLALPYSDTDLSVVFSSDSTHRSAPRLFDSFYNLSAYVTSKTGMLRLCEQYGPIYRTTWGGKVVTSNNSPFARSSREYDEEFRNNPFFVSNFLVLKHICTVKSGVACNTSNRDYFNQFAEVMDKFFRGDQFKAVTDHQIEYYLSSAINDVSNTKELRQAIEYPINMLFQKLFPEEIVQISETAKRLTRLYSKKYIDLSLYNRLREALNRISVIRIEEALETPYRLRSMSKQAKVLTNDSLITDVVFELKHILKTTP